MKIVKVYGELKERLGGQGTFEFDVFSPAEAIRALCANFAGLDKWFIDSADDGIAYKVLIGETEVGVDNFEHLLYPWSEKEVFHITPIFVGEILGKIWDAVSRPFKQLAKSSIGKILIGGALIAAAILMPGVGIAANWSANLGFFANLGAVSIYALIPLNLGLSLVSAGIAQALTPAPEPPAEYKAANKLKSFSFSGIQQTTQQGGPIPIVYGKCFIGSAVLSSGVDTFDA